MNSVVSERAESLQWVSRIATTTLFISGVALLVIMCAGAARAPLPHMSKLAIGFSASALLSEGISLYISNEIKKAALSQVSSPEEMLGIDMLFDSGSGATKMAMLISITLLALGILQELGKLDSYQVGCGMLVTSFAGGFVLKLGNCLYNCSKTVRNAQELAIRQQQVLQQQLMQQQQANG